MTAKDKVQALGFRLRMNPWDESEKIMVVGFDVPDRSAHNEPQQPPMNFIFCLNDRDSIAYAVNNRAHATLLWYRTTFLPIQKCKLRFCDWIRKWLWAHTDRDWTYFWWRLACRYKLDVENLERLAGV